MSRLSKLRAGLADRLARSSRVFLLGVIIACGIQVVNDWNATLGEVNKLRQAVRSKAENYVSILAKPSAEPLRGHDALALAHVSDGVLDDETAVCVRYYDRTATLVYDHLREDFQPTWTPHKDLYSHLMDRDVFGMLRDPAAYKARVASSRYRDFAQVWTDTTAHAVALVAKPKPPPSRLAYVLYQDRLRDESHRPDDRMTWAIGVIHDPATKEELGAVLVAFDMRATSEEIRAKYMKGGGIVLFFVALIVVQSLMSRRDKLRLLDLQTRYANAKEALMTAMPQGPLEAGGVRVAAALSQAKGPVDGMVWSTAASRKDGRPCAVVAVIDPDGDGIDAAAVGLHMLRVLRVRCEAGVGALDEEVAALGAATQDIPLTRPIGVALVVVDLETRAFEARLTKFAALRQLGASTPTLEPAPSPEGVVGPVFGARGSIGSGGTLLLFCAGLGERETLLEADALARYVERAHAVGAPLPVDDAVTWARGRSPGLSENDLAVVAVTSS